MFPEVYNIFIDKVLDKDSVEAERDAFSLNGARSYGVKLLKRLFGDTGLGVILNHKRKLRKLLKRFFGGMGLTLILNHKRKLRKTVKWMLAVGKELRFSDSDIFFLHDFESAYAFARCFAFKKAVFIYHQQGDLYAEWAGFTGRKSLMYKSYLTNIFLKTVKRTGHLGVPSNGAFTSLLSNEEKIHEKLSNVQFRTLYNGFTKPEVIKTSDAIKSTIDALKAFPGLRFSSVASLNYAKGVERVPRYLGQLKKAGYNIKWIIVGDGVKKRELEAAIEANGMENDTIWIKESVPHDDILNMFGNTDIYILLHRFSIFDYSTIEAMSYGNIPVLSRVGGNVEVIPGENGVLVDDDADASGLIAFLADRGSDIAALKKINSTLQERLFSEKSFLRNYYTLAESLSRGEEITADI
jgi:glycosyltransferase involved in cell wall biosynthesis